MCVTQAVVTGTTPVRPSATVSAGGPRGLCGLEEVRYGPQGNGDYVSEIQMSSDQTLTWLRAVRQIRELSQDDLVEASGISKVAISRLENARRRPRWDTALALARALDVQ